MRKNRQNQIIIIIVVIIVLFFIYMIYRSNNQHSTGIENFNNLSFQTYPENYSEIQLQQYYQIPSTGISQYTVDTMPCHPSCCGDQWPVSFDGLNSDQLQQHINNQNNPDNQGPFIRTNMTCGRGPNGVGCPCITKPGYLMLANRGQSDGSNSCVRNQVEPSLYVHSSVVPPNDYLAPYHNLSDYFPNSHLFNNSALTDSRLFNDEFRRTPTNDLSNLAPNPNQSISNKC